MHKNFRSVTKCVFGRGAFNQLGDILAPRRASAEDFVVFLVDAIFKDKPLGARMPAGPHDLLRFVDVAAEEPTTEQVDALVAEVRAHAPRVPVSVVGVGGGSLMDIAKAVALMLTNPGKAQQYQGLNLIKNPGVHHVGVPTLAGTGAEVSMTAVLTGPEKKLGLKSDPTVFDQIILDPDLVRDAPDPQRFFTGMDCFIHCVESLNGTKRNAFSDAYGTKALELCHNIFLSDMSRDEADEQLMVASYFGGLSLTYSEVGVCHALSYGLSYVLHHRHGIANCLVFNQLEDYYPEGVAAFKQMLDKHGVVLPARLAPAVTDDEYSRMADVALNLPFMWEHALGPDWRQRIDKDGIIHLYRRMNGEFEPALRV